MKVNKLILITVILLTTFILLFSSKVDAAQPVSDSRLNTVINQTNAALSLASIKLETGPSVGYGINFPNNYYIIKIIDGQGAELFTGKTLKGFNSTFIDPINLFLPYYNEAKKIQLLDENNALKLEIDLASRNLVGLKYRYTACDVCGYCPPDKPPSTWENCRKCLYPAASADPELKDTLKITDPTSNAGPTLIPEKTYSGIGCLDSAPEKNSQSILNIIFSIAGGVAFLYLLYGAFIVTTSQADPERLNNGKSIIKAAIIGLLVSLFSVFIVNLIAGGILRIPGFG